VIESPADQDRSVDHVPPSAGVSATDAVQVSASTRARLHPHRRPAPAPLSAAPDLTDDEWLADAMRQSLEQHGDLHVIVTEYVSALADAGCAPASIEQALAAIAAAHRAAGAARSAASQMSRPSTAVTAESNPSAWTYRYSDESGQPSTNQSPLGSAALTAWSHSTGAGASPPRGAGLDISRTHGW
jgi:hypothetical protein